MGFSPAHSSWAPLPTEEVGNEVIAVVPSVRGRKSVGPLEMVCSISGSRGSPHGKLAVRLSNLADHHP